MPQFTPDQVTFGDGPGYGYWDIAHHREHLQFVQTLAEQTTPVLLADYDFLQMLTAGKERRSIVESHNDAHDLLRQITGITGVDYSQFDLNNDGDFYSFLGYHAQEHQAIRAALGIT